MTVFQRQCLLVYFGKLTPDQIDGISGPLTQRTDAQFLAEYGVNLDTIGEAIAAALPGVSAPSTGATGTFWDEIHYFKRREFRCPCGKCGGFPVEPQELLVRAAEQLRIALGTPIVIIPEGDPHAGGSGVRCREYNDTLKPQSVSNSRHLDGKAIDFQAPGASKSRVESQLETMRRSGTIRYWYQISPGSWHMDIN